MLELRALMLHMYYYLFVAVDAKCSNRRPYYYLFVASWRRVMWLVSMFDQPALFERSCVRRVLMSKSNPPTLLSCVLFFPDYDLLELYFLYFSAISVETPSSNVVSSKRKKTDAFPS